MLNEKIYAEDSIQNGYISKKPTETLSILAKYWFYNGHKKNEVCQLMDEFMKQYYNNYNSVKWDLTLDKIATQAEKYELIQVNNVCVTQNEISVIQTLKSKPMQRVLFTMLCLAKFYNQTNSENNNWVNSKINDIFRLARVQISKVNKMLMLNDLMNLGLVKYSKKVDNLNICIQFIDNNSDVILTVDDFRELGYEYMKYCGDGKFINCANCGRLIRIKGKDNQTIRCNECQHKRNEELNRVSSKERMRRYRNK